MSLRATFSSNDNLNASFESERNLGASFGATQKIAELNYEKLINKPRINEVELIGNKTSNELGLQDHMDVITTEELINMLR